MKKQILLILPLLLFLSACGSRLPEKRPSDFYLSYSTGGGMTPYGSNIDVVGDTVHTSAFVNGLVVQATFQPQPAELDALYQAVVDNKFDRIQTYEEEIYDRGGSSLTITVNGMDINKSNGGMSFVEAGWADSYQNVVQAVKTLANRSAPNPASFVIEWDEALASVNPTIHLDMGGDFVSMSTPVSDDDRHAVFQTSNANSRYTVKVSTNYPTAIAADFLLDLTKTQHLKISIDKDQVLFDPAP